MQDLLCYCRAYSTNFSKVTSSYFSCRKRSSILSCSHLMHALKFVAMRLFIAVAETMHMHSCLTDHIGFKTLYHAWSIYGNKKTHLALCGFTAINPYTTMHGITITIVQQSQFHAHKVLKYNNIHAVMHCSYTTYTF